MAEIILKNLVKKFGDLVAVNNVNLTIKDREFLVLLGPSGCGKSTFIRCLNRMNDTIESCRITGEITLDGVDIYHKNIDVVPLRAQVGMVFQKPNPFPKSIYENIAYGPRIHGLASNKAELDEIVETVDQLGLVNPVVIGHSWGAWLAYIYASEYKVRYPVSKVILIGCGAFDEKYLSLMQESRYGKLTADEHNEANLYFNQLSHGKLRNLSGFNRLMSKMDAYEMTGYDDIDAFDTLALMVFTSLLSSCIKKSNLLPMESSMDI